MPRVESVHDPDRDVLFQRGQDGLGIEYFGPEIGQLGCFGVGDLWQGPGFRHHPGVGRHDAVHIGPDPDFPAVQAMAQDGRCIVTPPSPQGGDNPGRSSADEARHHRRDALSQEGHQAGLHPGPRLIHEGSSASIVVVGDDESGGLQGSGFHPQALQGCGKDPDQQPLPQRGDGIQPPGSQLSQDVDALAQALKLVQEGFDLAQQG